MRGKQESHPLQEFAVGLRERRRLVGVDVDLPDHLAVEGDRNHDLAARGDEAGQVAVVGVDIVHDLRPAARRGRAADALPDRDARVLGLLGALPRAEDEVVAFDEIDADPRVVVDALGQEVHRPS